MHLPGCKVAHILGVEILHDLTHYSVDFMFGFPSSMEAVIKDRVSASPSLPLKTRPVGSLRKRRVPLNEDGVKKEDGCRQRWWTSSE